MSDSQTRSLKYYISGSPYVVDVEFYTDRKKPNYIVQCFLISLRCYQRQSEILQPLCSLCNYPFFSNVSNFNLKYLHEIQRTQNTFSHNIMRSTIRAMCSRRNELNKQIIECRSQLSNVCPSVLLFTPKSKLSTPNSFII